MPTDLAAISPSLTNAEISPQVGEFHGEISSEIYENLGGQKLAENLTEKVVEISPKSRQ